jgi:pyruvate, water dikinase
MKYTCTFKEATKEEYIKLGGKGASLASMSAANFPVPIGFCITTDAYKTHLDDSGLWTQILEKAARIDFEDMSDLEKTATQIRDLILQTPIPEAISASIKNAYQQLCQLTNANDDLPVAVRSSANAEDLPDASFAGQQDTYLWIVGEKAVLEHVQKCWASLFTARAIHYRHDHNIQENDVLMCVVVQKMVNARVAGVIMTLNPTNGDRSKIAIDASWGLGEAVVSGEVTPDHFFVDKVMLEILKSDIHNKHIEHVPDKATRRVVIKEITDDRALEPCLTPEEVKDLCRMAKTIEKHYGCPQDIEWAIDFDLPEGENITLLQSRPETVWSQKKTEVAKSTPTFSFGMEGLVNSLLNPIAAKNIT